MKLYGSHSGITNVLDLGDNRGLQPNNEWTNTLYESQWCDDVAGFEHVRHNHPERHLRTPLMWSKELINEVYETKIQGPLGLSFGICVLTSIEGDLKLTRI